LLVCSLSVADVPAGRWRSLAGLTPPRAVNNTTPQHGETAPAPAVIQVRRAAGLEHRAGPVAGLQHPARCVGPTG